MNALEDRLDRYDIREFKAIIRYYILFVLLVVGTIFWLYIEFLRKCLIDGLGLTLIIVIYYYIHHRVYKPLKAKIELKREINRLNNIINQ